MHGACVFLRVLCCASSLGRSVQYTRVWHTHTPRAVGSLVIFFTLGRFCAVFSDLRSARGTRATFRKETRTHAYAEGGENFFFVLQVTSKTLWRAAPLGEINSPPGRAKRAEF